ADATAAGGHASGAAGAARRARGGAGGGRRGRGGGGGRAPHRRHTEPSGCSRRSHAAATTTSAGAVTAVVRATLRMRGLPRSRSFESGREVRATPHNGDRHARRLQPQELRLGTVRTSREARGLDV